ncbi:multiheme c-type cytochrome [Anaeromyxobacter paludicola]|uniref:Multiheme cytochrome n=1 Tax=Anaeromyxobacter paludicola TaxID=2918171 RepID=A0ABN6N7Q6_9BACT|nr:hypothetical protein [Anaeromyxobacter paludicola]BDG09227.1 hypothetical protein AMPC_23400 [Anaeromyxobacter paludicola]
MRRISLALALIGAVAVSGCGRSGSSASSGQKGANTDTFNINIYQAPVGGWITSADSRINCGASDLGTPVADADGVLHSTPTYITGHAVCPKQTTYPYGTSVTFTATADTGFTFITWAGDCAGSAATCTLTGKADAAPIAIFAKAGSAGHAAVFSSAEHGVAFGKFLQGDATAPKCTNCHGPTLLGAGIAPACSPCHQAANAANVTAGLESCAKCHAAAGTTGINNGADHQALYNKFAHPTNATLNASIVSVSTNTTSQVATVTFTLTKNGQPYTGDVTKLGQKTVYAARFDRATGKVVEYFSLSKLAPTATPGTFTAKNNATPAPATPPVTPVLATFAPEASDAFVYAYFAENPTLWPNLKNYKIYGNVTSAAMTFKATGQTDPWTYTSTANVAGCQKCHPTPYMKHGYRAAVVAGLPDFMACKACHADTRVGEDFIFQLTYDNFPWIAANGENYTPAIEAQYAYNASVMNDTHMAHSGEIKYPQEMSNCVVCHEGNLATITADQNFNGKVCKSCHPTTSPVDAAAPSFANVTDGAKLGQKLAYHNFNWQNGTVLEGTAPNQTELACTACHSDSAKDVNCDANYNCTVDQTSGAIDGKGPFMYGSYVPLFKDIHSGLNKAIYAADGSRYSASMQTTVGTTSFASNKLTLAFSVSNVPSNVTIKPTVTASLYGYDTKDFVVSGHSSQFSDKTPNLEFSEGACLRGTGGTTGVPCKPSNTARLNVTPLAAAGNSNWTVTIDLSTWATKLSDGSVKRIEVGFLPDATLVTGVAPNTVSTSIAISGLAVTYDLGAGAVVQDTVGKGANAIVDAAKCNNCHDALGTTFHSPSYGSAGVVGCRLCHFVGTGGSHLEMQSRSIDSYVHSIHSFQAFDIANVNFADPVAALEYEDHITATYPMFTTLNCESCHTAGSYGVPDQKKSMPGIQSASASITGKTRAINGVPSVVTGPASRACGGCHRAELIKEDAAGALNAFDDHAGASFGYRQVSDAAPKTITDKWNDIVMKVLP